jgi:hypothetical protein
VHDEAGTEVKEQKANGLYWATELFNYFTITPPTGEVQQFFVYPGIYDTGVTSRPVPA